MIGLSLNSRSVWFTCIPIPLSYLCWRLRNVQHLLFTSLIRNPIALIRKHAIERLFLLPRAFVIYVHLLVISATFRVLFILGSTCRLSVIWNPSTHTKARMTSTPWSPAGKSLAFPASSQLRQANGAACSSVTSPNLSSLRKFVSLTRLSDVKWDEVNLSIDNQN